MARSPHVRTRIRETLRAALVNGLPANQYDMGAARRAARNAKPLATVDIMASNDQTEKREYQGNVLDHTLSLYIRVTRQGSGTALDDALDQDEVLVNDIVMTTDFSVFCGENPVQPTQTNFSWSGDGEFDTGVIVMRYDFMYKTLEHDLTIVVI